MIAYRKEPPMNDHLAELNNPDELKWSAAHDLVAASDLLPDPEACQVRASGQCLRLGWRVIAEAGRDHRIHHHPPSNRWID